MRRFKSDSVMKFYDCMSQHAVNLFLEPFTECASVSVMNENRLHMGKTTD